jgi:serine/arginine repetitive matrix protein 2
MYNGIGLTTPRGSGTNGYVQKNLSFVKHRTERQEYARIDQIKPDVAKKPNQEILDHQKKRQIEVQIMQWVEDNNFATQG